MLNIESIIEEIEKELEEEKEQEKEQEEDRKTILFLLLSLKEEIKPDKNKNIDNQLNKELNDYIDSILSRPKDFFRKTNDAAKKINKDLGYKLIPEKKKDRFMLKIKTIVKKLSKELNKSDISKNKKKILSTKLSILASLSDTNPDMSLKELKKETAVKLKEINEIYKAAVENEALLGEKTKNIEI